VGQVSFTLDTWSDQRYGSYLVMTVHWIAEAEGSGTLQLKTLLIAFHRLHEGHTGRSMARTVRHLLDRAGVTTKVRRVFYLSDRCMLIYSRWDTSPWTMRQTTGP